MVNESKPTAEVWSDERCFITELLNDSALPDVSVARTRVEPGVTTELHALSVIEWYLIESGHGLMRVGHDKPYPVGPGDTIHIPACCEQNITNTADVDLLFLCVCVPRFTAAVYTSLE
ncbi:MAG: cupin domain-containing protein [Gammaproteobacteria bacterium]|nr:cupin domain-containing protein [Gammaproteobacteria bacterium]